MDLGLKGKVALVSGASRGIGRASAEELAREGADLVLVARDAAQLAGVKAAVERLGRRAEVHACDLSQPDAAASAVRAGIDAFQRIDIVVHSAGATKRGDFLSLTDADFNDGFALKFMGSVRLTRAAWPHLIKSSGAIVNIIGMGGRSAEADFTIGGAVNAAMMNFVKAMSVRGKREGVRVMGINPGITETDRTGRRLATAAAERGITIEAARQALIEHHGLTRLGKPEEIARLVCYLAGSTGEFMQGTIVAIDGGEFHGV